MAYPKITISFKESESQLYDRVKNCSCSPSVYIKDVLIKHFAELDAKENPSGKRCKAIDNFNI